MKKAFMIALMIPMLVSGCKSKPKAVDSVCSESVWQELSDEGEDAVKVPLMEPKGSLNESAEQIASSYSEPTQEIQETERTAKEISSPQKTNSKQTSSVKVDFFASEESKSETVRATSADGEEIAKRMVFYLNEYRKAQGTAPAAILTEYIPYAEYRSRQLVSHFAHDTVDEREAASAVKVGTYVDPSDYGMDGEPYYTADAREAIAMTGYVGTVEEVAKNLADLIRNSVDHWAYGGSAEYTQIAVGVTCAANGWYVDIAMKN